MRESSCGYTDRAPRACTVSGLESIRSFPSESSHGIILAGVKRLWALAPWHLGSHLNDFRSGSRNLQIHRGKSSSCMHPVWIGVDSGVPVRKLTRNHVIFMCYLAKGRFWSSPVRSFPLESIGIWRPLGVFDRHHAKIFGLISCCRTCQVSEPWHTGLDSSLS